MQICRQETGSDGGGTSDTDAAIPEMSAHTTVVVRLSDNMENC